MADPRAGPLLGRDRGGGSALVGGQCIDRSALAGWHLARRGYFGNSWRR